MLLKALSNLKPGIAHLMKKESQLHSREMKGGSG
jgi:hypothetical protein